MELREAVLSVAADLDQDAKDCQDVTLALRYLSYAKQLRLICEASAGVTHEHPTPLELVKFGPAGSRLVPWESLNKPPRQGKPDVAPPEPTVDTGSRMAECVGGALAGDLFPVDLQMPLWAKTRVGNQVYVLEEDGKLHFSATETLKIMEQMKKGLR